VVVGGGGGGWGAANKSFIIEPEFHLPGVE
jgi:hypothetical protein